MLIMPADPVEHGVARLALQHLDSVMGTTDAHALLDEGIDELDAVTLHGRVPAAAGPPAWTGWVLPLGMLLILWFLILRPQMRQQKQHRERVAGLAKGDEVVTAGGLVGKITKVDEHFVHVELAKGMTVKAVRNTIGEVLSSRNTPAAND